MINEFEKRIFSSLVIIPISFFFIFQGSVFFAFFLSIVFLLTSYEWIKMCKKFNSLKFFGIIFLLVSFFHAFLFRENIGLYNFLFIVLICIFTDLGGYLFGKIFKGPKLIKISPNKTYVGMLGGFFLPIIFVYLFLDNTKFLGFGTDYSFRKTEFIEVLAISLTSQIGDLIISYFKRLSKVKNTGKIIPGHGGLLDRIDGMIFAFPIAYIIFKI